MKNYLLSLLLLISVLISGCDKTCKNNQAMAKVNNYKISRDKFEAEFKDSRYSLNDNLASRKEFLDNLIDRKLILQEAERKGLDRDPAFLAAIERFWEQSLLKVALDKKMKEIMRSASVTDQEIRLRYDLLVKEAKTEKTYEQMRGQLKHEILKSKATQSIGEWVAGLRKNAIIDISPELTAEAKQGGI
jgi:hypothetical protein